MSATATKVAPATFCVGYPTPGREPSWYGPGRSPGDFAVGFGDTSILVNFGTPGTIFGFAGESDCEPINGIAFAGTRMAIASPEILRIVAADAFTGPTTRFARVHSHFGVHDVVAGRSGAIYASAGTNGLLYSPTSDFMETVLYAVRDDSVPAYIYRTCVLHQSDGTEIVVSAARRAGIVAQQIHPHTAGRAGRIFDSESLTVVDVCPLGLSAYPRGVLALSEDGATIAIADVFSDDPPIVWTSAETSGRAYRIFSIRGHLCLLTSKELRIERGRIRKLFNPRPVPLDVLSFSLEAVDAEAAWDRWLLVIGPEQLLKYDLSFVDTVNQKSTDRVNGTVKSSSQTVADSSSGSSHWAVRKWDPHYSSSELIAG